MNKLITILLALSLCITAGSIKDYYTSEEQNKSTIQTSIRVSSPTVVKMSNIEPVINQSSKTNITSSELLSNFYRYYTNLYNQFEFKLKFKQQLEDLSNYIESELARQEEIRKAEEKRQILLSQENPIAPSNMTPEEENLIMRVASLEAGNQGWVGMALVMRVILNRRLQYGISISEVIYAPHQFSVIGCDKWNNGFIAEEAPLALAAVESGWDESHGALYFCSPKNNKWHRSALTYLFTGWGHEFYK